MVPIGSFVAEFFMRDMAFQDDLGFRRYLQRHRQAIRHADPAAP